MPVVLCVSRVACVCAPMFPFESVSLFRGEVVFSWPARFVCARVLISLLGLVAGSRDARAVAVGELGGGERRATDQAGRPVLALE